MMGRILISLIMLAFAAACSPANEPSNDPYRAEALAACPLQKPYVNRDPDKVRKYCACVYDQTLKDLTAAEKMTARFYLLGQMGVDVNTREDFKAMDMSTMGTSSAAIGKAVKICGRR